MNSTRILGSLLLTALITTPAMADEPAQDNGWDRDHRPGRHGLLKQADRDGDRAVTLDDWKAFVLAADTDGDGSLDAQELAALRPADAPSRDERRGRRGRGGMGAGSDEPMTTDRLIELHGRLDRNGDGTVDRDDRSRRGPRGRRGPARLRGRGASAGPALARAADAHGNGDGAVTREEWQSFLEASDTDGNGSLSGAEILTASASQRPHAEERQPTLDELAQRFDDLDTNGDGELRDDELTRFPRRQHGR